VDVADYVCAISPRPDRHFFIGRHAIEVPICVERTDELPL